MKKTKREGWKGKLLPAVDLHGTLLGQVLVHLEGLEEQVRLMTHALLEQIEFRPVEVIRQDGLVVGVRALLDDDTGPLTRRETTDVGESLLGDDHVEVVLGLVNVGGEGNDAGHTGRVRLAGTRTGGVHDTVLGVPEEVGGTTQTVEHARAEDAGAVGVGEDVDFNGGVHTDAVQTTDDLGRVRDELRTQEQLVRVLVPVVEEALEAGRREPDGGGRGEVQVAAVEQVQERVLQHLRPHLEVLEVGTALAQAANDGVGNVSNAGLQGVQVLGHTTLSDLVLEELNQVARNRLRGLILRRVVGGAVGVVTLHDGNDLLGVHGDMGGTDTVFGAHDKHGLGVRGLLGHVDVVQSLKRGARGVNLNDDLVGHLDDFGRRTHRRTGDDATILGDGRGFDNGNVELVVRLVPRVPALVIVSIFRTPRPNCEREAYVQQILRKHAQMLIEKVDLPRVQPFGNRLANLVGTPALDHVQIGPAALRLRARRGTHEQGVSQLALKVVLLDMVRQRGGNFPVSLLISHLISSRSSSCGLGEGHDDVLGIPDSRETGPADVGAIREERNEILWLRELAQVGRPLHAVSEESRRHGDEGETGQEKEKEEWRWDGKIWGWETRREEEKKEERRKRRNGGETRNIKRQAWNLPRLSIPNNSNSSPRAGGEAKVRLHNTACSGEPEPDDPTLYRVQTEYSTDVYGMLWAILPVKVRTPNHANGLHSPDIILYSTLHTRAELSVLYPVLSTACTYSRVKVYVSMDDRLALYTIIMTFVRFRFSANIPHSAIMTSIGIPSALLRSLARVILQPSRIARFWHLKPDPVG